MSYSNSIVLVQSQDESNDRFGTGFTFHRNSGSVFILTCAHVVNDVGGKDKVKIQGTPANVVAIGEEDGLDIAVLCVKSLHERPLLRLRDNGERGDYFTTEGYQNSNGYLLSPLHGCLGERISFLPKKENSEQVKAWDLIIDGEYALQGGYSGSPVISKKTGRVIAIVSQRLGSGKSGRAISVEAISSIWDVPDIEKVHSALLKLGYQEQVGLFSKLARKHSIAAFLIHGPSDHGQRWLLNRLVTQHIPQSLAINPIAINLGTRSRKNVINSLWRELGGRFGLRGSLAIAENIVIRVHEAWRNRHVIVIMESVHLIPEPELRKIINDFWLPLVEKCNDAKNSSKESKLYIFLIDYEGITSEWNLPFVERIDVTWRPQVPIKSPRLTSFAYEDLTDWIVRAEEDLPNSMVNLIDDAVDDILDNSDGGIPEFVLDELCFKLGFDWHEVKSNWLKI